MAESIFIRPISDYSEMTVVEDLQKEVWNFPDLEIVPAAHLAAAVGAGGCLLGAFDGERMVGFVYGFGGIEHGVHAHHSHMLAVLAEYRNRDLGRKLKIAQKEFVLNLGIKLMSWTFDPLQCTNAYFNFHKLGAFSSEYFVNFYGEEAGSPLHQTGTDRLWMQWGLADSVSKAEHAEQWNSASTIVAVGTGEVPVPLPAELGSCSSVCIEVPRDINKLQHSDMSLAVEWRNETRRAFVQAFTHGYVAVDFKKHAPDSLSGGVYLLVKRESL